MKIQIMGASCAGSTTLGRALAESLNIPFFDTDEYFWVLTDPPFTTKREPGLRNRTIKEDMAKHESWVQAGSVIKWGADWEEMFDVVVFLYIPHELRMQRLIARELERYGDIIFTNPARAQQHQEFVAWADKYEDITFSGRNIKAHEDWLSRVNARVLQIRGDTTVKERVEKVLAFLKSADLR
ncbi:shikimate kinase [Mucilaginibacter sp.]|uniref:shikimate kinase n=1 Tax=Mucilaginibacter sp. TaxID=1882438 RepID=UPI003264B1B5